MTTKNSLKIALCQLSVSANKSQNISHACNIINKAVKNHQAELVVLPECFNSPYGTQHFPKYAEDLQQSETLAAIADCARTNKVHIIAGSIPTLENEKYYNTSTVFDSKGDMVAVHRKVHLFDIDIPGKITFRESDILAPGRQLTHFDMRRENGESVRVGLGICFDVRFAEMAQILAKDGVQLMVYPGAFNMTTGPAHWELLARARAVDNQFWVAMCSPARDENAGYVAWGHSLLVDPWGKVVCEAQEKEDIITHTVDLQQSQDIRNQIPVMSAKGDVYTVTMDDRREKGEPVVENKEKQQV